jgi:hypothetical protein
MKNVIKSALVASTALTSLATAASANTDLLGGATAPAIMSAGPTPVNPSSCKWADEPSKKATVNKVGGGATAVSSSFQWNGAGTVDTSTFAKKSLLVTVDENNPVRIQIGHGASSGGTTIDGAVVLSQNTDKVVNDGLNITPSLSNGSNQSYAFDVSTWSSFGTVSINGTKEITLDITTPGTYTIPFELHQNWKMSNVDNTGDATIVYTNANYNETTHIKRIGGVKFQPNVSCAVGTANFPAPGLTITDLFMSNTTGVLARNFDTFIMWDKTEVCKYISHTNGEMSYNYDTNKWSMTTAPVVNLESSGEVTFAITNDNNLYEATDLTSAAASGVWDYTAGSVESKFSGVNGTSNITSAKMEFLPAGPGAWSASVGGEMEVTSGQMKSETDYTTKHIMTCVKTNP